MATAASSNSALKSRTLWGRHAFVTALTPEECLDRLGKYRREPFRLAHLFFIPSEGTIWVSIRGFRFRLYAAGSNRSQYSAWFFGPFFYGELIPFRQGSRIDGRFQYGNAVRLPIALWFTLACAAFVVTVGMALKSGSGFYIPLIPLGMLLFFSGFFRFVMWWERRQIETMRDFLESELEARTESAPAGASDSSHR